MDKQPTVHPFVIESHAKVKAWNEYVIEHLGLKVVKESRKDYRSLHVFQGSFCLYHNWVVTVTKTTNAEMHKYLYQFLKQYLEHFSSFNGIASNPDFKPPKV